MNFFAFLFDTFAMKEMFYGQKAFDCIVGALDKYNDKIIIRSGDFGRPFYGTLDVEPYVIRDDNCTVGNVENVADYLFAVCLDGISVENARRIDEKCGSIKGYLGMTTLSKETIVSSKQFYKNLPINMYVIDNKVFYEDYGDKQAGSYANVFEKYNYDISFSDDFFNYETEDSLAIDLIGNKMELSYKLNMEVRISGNLIWDSVERINKISFFQKELGVLEPYIIENCYMSLYNAAQGIERLQKVLVMLLIRKNNVSVKNERKVYELLYHHNHIELNQYLKNEINLKVANSGKLCNMLCEFYNKIRYINYGTDEYSNSKFYDLIYDSFPNKNENEDTTIYIRKTFVNLMGQYAKKLYNHIRDVSCDLAIYTYELSDSPAVYVFLGDDSLYDIYCRVNICKMEFLNWLSGNKQITKFKPLSFDKEDAFRNISSIIKDDSFFCYDYVSELYDELYQKNKKEFKDRYGAFKMLSDL